MEEIELFRSLKSDKERWAYLIHNASTTKLMVMLDNDDTFVIDSSNNDPVSFDKYIGWSDGVFILLYALGINCESV